MASSHTNRLVAREDRPTYTGSGFRTYREPIASSTVSSYRPTAKRSREQQYSSFQQERFPDRPQVHQQESGHRMNYVAEQISPHGAYTNLINQSVRPGVGSHADSSSLLSGESSGSELRDQRASSLTSADEGASCRSGDGCTHSETEYLSTETVTSGRSSIVLPTIPSDALTFASADSSHSDYITVDEECDLEQNLESSSHLVTNVPDMNKYQIAAVHMSPRRSLRKKRDPEYDNFADDSDSDENFRGNKKYKKSSRFKLRYANSFNKNQRSGYRSKTFRNNSSYVTREATGHTHRSEGNNEKYRDARPREATGHTHRSDGNNEKYRDVTSDSRFCEELESSNNCSQISDMDQEYGNAAAAIVAQPATNDALIQTIEKLLEILSEKGKKKFRKAYKFGRKILALLSNKFRVSIQIVMTLFNQFLAFLKPLGITGPIQQSQITS